MPWNETPFARDLGLRVPIVQAPMAGGPSTPRLAAAVSEAGGLGSIAGAMLGPDALRDAIAGVRSRTSRPFAVNLFVPLPPPSDRGVAAWAELLGSPVPSSPAVPRFEDQLAVVVEARVPVLSWTFGIPPLGEIDAYRLGTATTTDEARALEAAGVDAIVVQGFEAGGHRGAFLEAPDVSLIGTLALVPQAVDAVRVPVVAAGGIADGRGVAAALVLGAQGVQLGTAFLACDEAGTSAEHRLRLGEATTITRVLTGRAARAIRTAEVERLEAAGMVPPDYPLPRAFAGAEPPLLAGQAAALARAVPAGELVHALERETAAALTAASR